MLGQWGLRNVECEDIWLNAVEPCTNSIINVIVLYRHPNTCKKKFSLKLGEALDKQPFANTTTHILSDVNLDINKFNRSTLAQNYPDGLISKVFFPLITQPTRVTDTSASIIDHIITNDLSHKLIPGIIRTDDLSDHYMIYVIIRDKNKSEVKRCKRIKLRDTSNFSPTTFKNDLVVAFSEFLNSLPEVDENNFNIVFNDFHDRFTKVLDKNAPFKLLSRKRSKLAHKPWISKGILASIRNKQKMYKTHFIGGSEIAKMSYKAYANKLTKVKCLVKKLYFYRELENCKGDGRKIWDLLYSLLPSKKKQTVS